MWTIYDVVVIVVTLIFVCILALAMTHNNQQTWHAGSELQNQKNKKILESKNLVVDTLNLAHLLHEQINIDEIIATIDATAPVLRRHYPGRIIYVTKNREMHQNKADAAQMRELYRAAARRNRVYISVVERIPNLVSKSMDHSALGRDDFYLMMLAWKLRCPVLSRDRFRDLTNMKVGHLDKFHVYTFSPVKDLPERDFVNPAAAEFARMQRPITIDYAELLPALTLC